MNLKLEKEDECETASEIYQCGRDANLPIMDQIYTTEKGNATVVCFISTDCRAVAIKVSCQR